MDLSWNSVSALPELLTPVKRGVGNCGPHPFIETVGGCQAAARELGLPDTTAATVATAAAATVAAATTASVTNYLVKFDGPSVHLQPKF